MTDTAQVVDDLRSFCQAADQVLTDNRGRFHLRVRPGRYRLRVWTPAAQAGDGRVIAALPAVTCSARRTLVAIESHRLHEQV